jgi:hypothetical protein
MIAELAKKTAEGVAEKNLTSLKVEIGSLMKKLDDMYWLNLTYVLNKTYLIERQNYVKVLEN